LVAVGWLDIAPTRRELLAAGVATHHQDGPEILRRYPYGENARDELLKELSSEDESALREWLQGQGAPDPSHWGFDRIPALRVISPAQALAEGMRALALVIEQVDTLNATEPESLTFRTLRGLVVLADHAGSAHERHRDAPSLRSPTHLFEHLRGKGWSRFWPHQVECARIIGHCLLIAPTGSGKTEAALLWSAHQHEQSTAERPVFYVLPYRASLNAMRLRITERYGVPEGAVVLQHAKATADLYSFLTSKKGYTGDEAVRAARHEQNLGRLMTAPVRVLTPYQFLKAVFGLRGHEAILTDAAGGLFILDELHAYDVQRLSLILAVIHHLANHLGACFLAMSATFPKVLRAMLTEVLGKEPQVVRADTATEAEFRRHVLHVIDGDLLAPATLDQIAARYFRGEAVLVVATTVARAQQLFDALQSRVSNEAVWLLHSRFTAADRAEKEQHLASRVGIGRRKADDPGTILVATQVVEVSLDVDFDVLFSDPAPLEALVQRFGRVNRARRGELRDVFVSSINPKESGLVYQTSDVQRAVDLLRPKSGQPLDERDVQEMVDAAYEPVASEWQNEVRYRIARAVGDIINANHPLSSHPELEAAFNELFDGYEVVPRAMETEYLHRVEEEPLAASLLRVPISNGQCHRLRRAGRLQGEIADVPYDRIRGLNLSFRDDEA
jgi:CRISPR-associated endonuclease/helicase Cas3